MHVCWGPRVRSSSTHIYTKSWTKTMATDVYTRNHRQKQWWLLTMVARKPSAHRINCFSFWCYEDQREQMEWTFHDGTANFPLQLFSYYCNVGGLYCGNTELDGKVTCSVIVIHSSKKNTCTTDSAVQPLLYCPCAPYIGYNTTQPRPDACSCSTATVTRERKQLQCGEAYRGHGANRLKKELDAQNVPVKANNQQEEGCT